jgi:hypothetical protein
MKLSCAPSELTLPANSKQHCDAREINEVGSKSMRKQKVPHHEDVIKWEFSTPEEAHPATSISQHKLHQAVLISQQLTLKIFAAKHQQLPSAPLVHDQ